MKSVLLVAVGIGIGAVMTTLLAKSPNRGGCDIRLLTPRDAQQHARTVAVRGHVSPRLAGADLFVDGIYVPPMPDGVFELTRYYRTAGAKTLVVEAYRKSGTKPVARRVVHITVGPDSPELVRAAEGIRGAIARLRSDGAQDRQVLKELSRWKDAARVALLPSVNSELVEVYPEVQAFLLLNMIRETPAIEGFEIALAGIQQENRLLRDAGEAAMQPLVGIEFRSLMSQFRDDRDQLVSALRDWKIVFGDDAADRLDGRRARPLVPR